MRWFQRKPKCPNCNQSLEKKPARKKKCPQCGQYIYVRSGKLVTEAEASITDWLTRLEGYGVTDKDFVKHHKELSAQFGFPASVNDTVWRILNDLKIQYANEPHTQAFISREMASLVSSEGKDPTQFLLESEQVLNRAGRNQESGEQRYVLGHDELAYARKLRNEGELDKTEAFLLKADPSPAVLDEMRKLASTRAKQAKKDGDWEAVVAHLEGYNRYAEQRRDYCIRSVNQEPPKHTKRDMNLLNQAKTKLTE